MLRTPHPAGPRKRPEPFLGEPFELTKTRQPVSTTISAGVANSATAAAERCLVVLSVGPAWGPEPGQLGDERRKRKLMIRAEGGLVNPYRSSLLESHIAALSGDPEPRRARTCPLPHIRQANVHVMERV